MFVENVLFIRIFTFFALLIISYNLAEESTEEIVFPIDQFVFNTDKFDDNIDIFKVCDETLGCIETDSRWYHKLYRPVNLRPLPRHILRTEFLLIKNHNSNINELFYNNLLPKASAIKESEFKNDSELMILIHDFTANGYTGWIKHLAKTVFIHSVDINLISVDWQRGAEPPYDQAVANARMVALEVTGLIKELKEKCNYSLSNIHIVGHGLGAHIAGYVGVTFNKIKKITGLDPSGPRFQGMPDLVKLNAKSAKYVEIIHTDYYESRSQGINETLGHSDFYINGARKQPGCPENTSFDSLLTLERTSLKQGEILPGCSHKRAFKYFVESLANKNCYFQGIKCGSLSDFENGKCTHCNVSDHDCRVFGLKTYADSSEGNRFFLNTAARYPYCLLEYRIGVYITGEEKLGYFNFILVDENGNVSEAALSTEEESYRVFKSGTDNKNTLVYFASPPRLHKLKEAKVKWTEKKKIYCFIFCRLTINVEKISVAFLGTGNDDQKNFFCPQEDRVQIESGSYVTFRRCTEKTEPYNTPLGSVKETLTKSDRIHENATLLPTVTSTKSDSLNKNATMLPTKTSTKSDSIHENATMLPNETLTKSDRLQRNATMLPTETLTSSDRLHRNATMLPTETLTKSDRLHRNATMLPTETLTKSDRLHRNATMLPTETLTKSDRLHRNATMLPTETLTKSDRLHRNATMLPTETLTKSDRLHRNATMLPSETLTKSDRLHRNATMLPTETLAKSDSLHENATMLPSETLTKSDRLYRNASLLPTETTLVKSNSPIIPITTVSSNSSSTNNI